MTFTERYSSETTGTLSGFDRLVFSGHLRSFFQKNGMYYYMSQMGVKLTGFKDFMATQTKNFRSYMSDFAQASGIEITYLNDRSKSKDEVAKAAYAKHPTKEGLVAIISTQELAYSFSLVSNRERNELEVIHHQIFAFFHFGRWNFMSFHRDKAKETLFALYNF